MARNVSIKFSADVASYLAGVSRAEAGTKQFASRANSYVKSHDDQISRMSGTAGLIGTAVAVGVGGAIKTYANFDQSMSNVAATGDQARANIDGLRDAAIDMGAKTAFSATEAAGGVENLLKAGVSAKEVLGGGLKGALDLAAAGSIGVGDASEIAATAMTQFKLSGQDVPHIADLLAAAAGKAQGEVSDMAAALGQSGLVAAQFGLSIEDTTGTLAAFASNGLLGSDAGTSFKTMLLSLASPSKASTALMEKLGIAAYDTQGNFVGVTSLAEQLKTKLGPLSQAQRDAALSTIFGSDAIRAANVLYEQGGKGITSWIGKVNDSGYASETAATKLNNLNGDLEAFRGSAETALIGLGKAGDGPLRSLVQGATDVLNAFTALSDGTKGAVLATAGSAAGLLLLGAAAGKVVIFANSARLAMVALGISARVAVLSIPVLGIALAAVSTVVAHFASKSQEAKQTTTDYDSAIAGMTGTVDKNTIALNDNVRATTAKRLQDSGALDTASRLGLSLETVTSATLGNKGALTELNGVLSTNLALNPQLSAANSDRRNDASQLAQALGTEALAALESTRKANQLKDATVQGGQAASGAATSSGELAGAQKILAGKTKDLKDATQNLKDETQKLIDKFTILKNGALDQESANAGWEASIDAVSDSVRSNRRDLDEQVKAGKLSKKEADARSRSLDVNTAAGRTNRKSVTDQITALNDKITADFKAGLTTENLGKKTDIASAALKTGRKRIDETTTAAGLSKDEVKRMQDRMVLTPKELRTQINTPGMANAQTQVDTLGNKVRDLKNKSIDVKVGIKFDPNKLAASMIKGDYFNNPGAFQTRAAGGPIQNLSGRGRKGKDTEPVLAAYGEHMWTDKEVDAAGGHDSVYRIRKAALRGELRGFAAGGGIYRTINVNTSASRPPAAALEHLVPNLLVASGKAGTKYAEDVGEAFAKAALKKYKDAALTGGAAAGTIDVNNPRGLTTYRGGQFTNLFAANLRRAEKLAGQQLRVFQGGFRPGTSYSGTSHRGDAVDAQASAAVIRALRRVGIASGDRTGLGNWVSHSHSVPTKGAGFGAGSAVWQAQDYLRRGGASQSLGSTWGLASGGIVKGGSGGVTARVGEGRFDELVTPLPPGWNMSKADTGSIQKLINALANPLKALTAATKVMNVARSQANYEKSLITRPLQYLRDTTTRYRSAVERRDDLRAQSVTLRKRIEDQKGKSRVEIDYKRAVDDLRQANLKVTSTGKSKGTPAGVRRNRAAIDDRDDLREEVAQLKKRADAMRGNTRAEKDYKRVTQELRQANLQVAETTKKRTAAQELYNRVAERAKEATEKLKAAEQILADQRQAVADAAKAVSDTFSGRYTNSAVTDPAEIIAQKRAGAAELDKFNAQIQRLRKSGLNEDAISEIVDRGPVGGGELAVAILASGQGLIRALNTAQANLTKAADGLGLTVATGTIRRAGGGWLKGPGTTTSDSIPWMGSRDEFVVNAASAKVNADLLERVNSSPRRVVDRNYATPRREYGGAMQQGPQVVHHRPLTVNIAMPETGNWESAASGLADRVVADLTAAGL